MGRARGVSFNFPLKHHACLLLRLYVCVCWLVKPRVKCTTNEVICPNMDRSLFIRFLSNIFIFCDFHDYTFFCTFLPPRLSIPLLYLLNAQIRCKTIKSLNLPSHWTGDPEVLRALPFTNSSVAFLVTYLTGVWNLQLFECINLWKVDRDITSAGC